HSGFRSGVPLGIFRLVADFRTVAMSQEVSNFSLVVLPKPSGGAIFFAVEDFALAFCPGAEQMGIDDLLVIRDWIEKGFRDEADRPTATQLKHYGARIAGVLLAGDVSSLYSAVGHGRVQVSLSMHDSGLKRVPWEYLCWPGLAYGPHI